MSTDYTIELFELTTSLGAVQTGVADLSSLQTIKTSPNNLLTNFIYAISVAVVIPNSVFRRITKKNPGEIYAHNYKTANTLLDQITFRTSEKIIDYGYRALAIPASLSLTRLMGNAPHKAFARAAGLGWIGKNLLLITPEYGPRIRLATVLTDIPLKPGNPIEHQCGDCTKCIDACPVGALKHFNFDDYPSRREDAFDAQKCSDRLDNMEKLSNIGVSICGLCIKVCPIGK
jgi:epoxyqueuosine reductase QueG